MDHRFIVRLIGEAARGARLEAGLLRDLLDLLVEGAQGALRLRVEGRSQAPGPAPAWLARAAAMDFVGLDSGSTSVLLEASSIADGAPQFAQLQLFHDFDPRCSAMHLFSESLCEAVAARRDSELFDQALLKKFSHLTEVFDSGVERLEISNRSAKAYSVVDKADLAGVKELIRSTPPNQRVRLAGRLDTIRHSDRMFVLELEDGSRVKGVAEGVTPKQLAHQFGKTVGITGSAVFRPSGRVLRVEADSVVTAEPGELGVWSRQPRPTFGPGEKSSFVQPQGPRTGLNAIIGKWPGDETDEQFLEALAELS